MKLLKYIASSIIVLFIGVNLNANQTSRQQIIAAYIYNLSKNITWENEQGLNAFKVLIVDSESETNKQIKSLLESRELKGIQITVDLKENNFDLNSYQLIFIPQNRIRNHEIIFQRAQYKNILIITEEALNKNKILVNLSDDGKNGFGFEINKENLKNNRLIIQPEILLLVGSKDDIRIMFDEIKVKLEAEQTKVHEQESIVNMKDKQISDQMLLIELRQAFIDSLRHEIVKTSDSLISVESKIWETEMVLSKQYNVIAKQNLELKKQNLSYKEKEIQLKEKEQELQDYIYEIEESKNSLAKLSNDISDKQNEINEKNLSIKEQEELLRNKERYNILLFALLSVLFAFFVTIIRAYFINRNFSRSLEMKVARRTVELNQSNVMLKREIETRKEKENELLINKNRILQLFENSPIAILEQDLSELRQKLSKLKFKDKIELRNYLNSNPDIIKDLCTEFKVIDANYEAARFFSVKDLNELKKRYSNEYYPITLDGFIEEIYIINKGQLEMEQETILKDFEGNHKNVILRWIVLPGFEDFSRVLVSIKDITPIKEAEKQLKNYQSDLEDLVKQRTYKIQEINTNLKEANEALIEQRKELEEAVLSLRETQIQLIQSEKMATIGILTAGVAHEINNPINFINSGLIGFRKSLNNIIHSLDSLRNASKLSSDEKFQEKLVKIEKEGEIDYNISALTKMADSIKIGTERTIEIVKSLRTFARSSDEVMCPANIHDGIDSTLVMLYHQYKSRIVINKEYAELPLVTCIPGKLNQVFMNLISNSIQAIPKKGTITIRSEYLKESKKVMIKIIDDGMGIPKQHQDKIFDPFFTTKPVGKGTGLGLYLSYMILEEHMGKISLKSKENEGAEFTITIPVDQIKT